MAPFPEHAEKESSMNRMNQQVVSDDNLEYNMSHIGGRGIAVIFSYSEYVHSKLRRDSMEYEIGTMTNTYKVLGFKDEEITAHRNLSTACVNEEIRKLQDIDYSDLDCLSITIASHGVDDHFHTSDGVIPLVKIVNSFLSDKVPSLAGKPKIFFGQFCRGNETDSGVQFLQPAVSPTCERGGCGEVTDSGQMTYTLPTTADLLIALSTTKGFVSFRTPFVKHLFKTVKESNREKEDLTSMLVMAYRKVATTFVSNNVFEPRIYRKTQMPTLITTLTRKIYFRDRV